MNLKSQKGAVTLFVLVSCMFFLASVVSVQMYMQSKQIAVNDEYRRIKENYEKDLENIDQLYNGLYSEENMVVNFGVPSINASTKKIVVEFSTNLENAHIDTVKYGWVHSNTEITDPSESNMPNITNWIYIEKQDGESKFNAVLNYEDNKGYYYLCANINNKEYWTQVNKYAKEGLVLHLDGINNKGTGDQDRITSTTEQNGTTWKNLVGETLNGTLKNFSNTTSSGWGEDYLKFDGTNDWVSIGQINYPQITIEAVVENSRTNNLLEATYVGNWQSGGYGLVYNSSSTPLRNNRNQFCTYTINNDRQIVDIGREIESNKKYILTGSYDGNIIKFWENGQKTETQGNGVIKEPRNNTVIALGTDALGSTSGLTFLNGKIYSVRIYNRALTEEEVQQNYQIDKMRFNVTD